ncbi:hypothetical protein HPB50_021488 [Hyalomma asiaticum]|uniref:Uncharacterized protein n=1 Tax=Hyalomma asiaticum TaxID=266040 RepID=A0ACB7SGU2_HYAAI|nr:hypothetical protein HPB50_021488 [Hyalomma asiaticum]
MDVKRKRKLVVMAAALEIAAEDDKYDDECGFLRRKRSVWVKPWLTRKSLGMQNQLYQELLASDPEEYKHLLCLSCEQFDQLLTLIQPWIGRQDTAMRSSVPAKTRLQVTLRFLASGYLGHAKWSRTPLAHSSIASDFCTRALMRIRKKWTHLLQLHVRLTTFVARTSVSVRVNSPTKFRKTLFFLSNKCVAAD